MRKRSIAVVALPFMLLLSLVGCGPKEPPSEAEARRLFESKLRGPLERAEMRVRSFTKLGGSNLDDDRYNVDYRAEVECLQSAGSIKESTAILGIEARQGYISFQFDKNQPAQVRCTFQFQQAVPHASVIFRKASGAWQGES